MRRSLPNSKRRGDTCFGVASSLLLAQDACPGGVSEVECVADVLEDKEGLALFVCHDADVVDEVVEDGDVVRRLFSFIELLLGWRFMEV